MRRYLHAAALCLAYMLLAGCDGIFDGIYDTPVADADLRPGFNEGSRPGRFTILLDARDYDSWLYLDLHRRTVDSRPLPVALNGEWDGRSVRGRYHVVGTRYTLLEEKPVDAQAEPEEWDLAVHHFDIQTNGGAVLRTGYPSVDAVPEPWTAGVEDGFVCDEWTLHQCMVDLSGMFDRNIWYQSSMVNPVLTGWVKMDLSTPPPKYEADRSVCLLRMADGSVAALQMKSYMSEAGTKGFLTIDVRYPLPVEHEGADAGQGGTER